MELDSIDALRAAVYSAEAGILVLILDGLVPQPQSMPFEDAQFILTAE